MTSQEIKPGQGVAVFRLPMPMNGIELINDTLQRIYGTGNWTLQFNGDQIQFTAPDEGFGPPKRRRRTPPADVNADEKMAYLKSDSGKLEVTLEQSQDVVVQLMATTQLWFAEVGGINYVEFSLQGPNNEPQPYVYCVQKRDGATPHTKRQEAEAEVARLRGLLESIAEENVNGTDDDTRYLRIQALVNQTVEQLPSAPAGGLES